MRGGEKESNVTYMNITAGKIRESYNIDENTPGAKSRIVNNPQDGTSKTVWEVVDDFISGYVKGLKVYQEEFNGVKINLIELTLFDPDKEETYAIKMRKNSGYGGKLLGRLPNCDLKQPIKIIPYAFEDDGKKIIGLNVFQQETPADLDFIKKIDPLSTDDMPKFPGRDDEFKFKEWQLKYEYYMDSYIKEKFIPSIPEKPWEDLMGRPEKPAAPIKEDDNFAPEEDDQLPF